MAVRDVTMYVNNNYTYKTFESCNEVVHSQTGNDAIGVMCGKWGAELCTPERWYDYQGNATENPIAPFNIFYFYSNETTEFDDEGNEYEVFNSETLLCHQAFEGKVS